MDTETLSMIAAVTSIITAIGSVFAAVAAFRAAATARAAVKHGIEREKRRLVGQVVRAAQGAEAEHMRVAEVAPDLKLAYKELYSFAGGSNSSRLKMHQERIDKAVMDGEPLKDEAIKYLADLKSSPDMSD